MIPQVAIGFDAQVLGPAAKFLKVFTFLNLYVFKILQEAPVSGCTSLDCNRENETGVEV